MDNRFLKIQRLLMAYSLGKFDRKLAVSSREDEVDGFIAGVNMLGEELKARTISRDYFNDIFHSVSDMVFVLDRTGKIENINDAVTSLLQYDLNALRNKTITSLSAKQREGWFAGLLKDIRTQGVGNYETVFRTKDKQPVPVLISASYLDGKNARKKILLTAKDIADQKETQNRILKAIIETEEKERIRFAKDIHDSLGQQLSAIKFYIGTSADSIQDPQQKSILLKANAALIEVQADMRNICFNIMPKSLEVFGLVKAVEELSSKNELLNHIKISVKESPHFPALPVQQGFAIFRIIQEFINNAIKHSKANTLKIEFTSKKKMVFVTLSDNGVGFDIDKLRTRGMGLNNVMSRIRPYGGEVDIISQPGRGTRYEIFVPVDE